MVKSLISGPCVGGPYNGRPMHHGERAHGVTYERDRPMKAVPGMVEPTYPHLARGAYVFHPTSECWHWFADIKAAPVSGPKYAVWITETPPTA